VLLWAQIALICARNKRPVMSRLATHKADMAYRATVEMSRLLRSAALARIRGRLAACCEFGQPVQCRLLVESSRGTEGCGQILEVGSGGLPV